MRVTRLGSAARAIAGAAIAVTLISVTQVAAAPREQLIASPTSRAGTGLALVTPTEAVLTTTQLQLEQSSPVSSPWAIPRLWGDPLAQTPDLEVPEIVDVEAFTENLDAPVTPGTDCTVVKCVAITIDDGPGPHTRALLAELAAAGARATFFVVGAEVARHPELTAAIVDGGHELGLHSHTHPRMTALGDQAVLREFERSRQAIYDAVSQEVSIYRPPYGMHSKRIGRLANAAIIMWDVDPQDWRRGNQRKLVNHVEARVQPGSIILLHELAATTRALPEMLQELTADGYQLVTISELLGAELVWGQVYRSGQAPQPAR